VHIPALREHALPEATQSDVFWSQQPLEAQTPPSQQG
jgi:hypothetical protein